jgi:hypothetical protein
MKLTFRGDRPETFVSHPAGVFLHAKPGKPVEVDAGFEYLKLDTRFEPLDEADASEGEEKKSKTKRG